MGKWQGVSAASKTTIAIDFYYSGIRCREKLKLPPTAPNMRYASDMRTRILEEIAKNEFNYSDYFPHSKNIKKFTSIGSRQTIKDALLAFLDSDYTRNRLQPTTLEEYTKSVHSRLIPAFGELALCEFKRVHAIEWVSQFHVTTKTLSNHLLPLRCVLADAADREVIPSNPLHGWSPKGSKKSSKRDEIDPFQPKEINAILNKAKELSKKDMRWETIYNIIVLVSRTGVRPSEWQGLEWSNVDFINNKIRIRGACVNGHAKETKTEAGNRDIEADKEVMRALKLQKKYTYLEGKRVFHNPNTGKPWTGNKMRETFWQPLLKMAGIRYRYPNQLRHSWATMALAAGENAQWVAYQLGHTDWTFTVKTYTRFVREFFPDAGKNIQAFWEANG